MCLHGGWSPRNEEGYRFLSPGEAPGCHSRVCFQLLQVEVTYTQQADWHPSE